MEFAFGLVPSADLESFSQLIARAEAWGFDMAYVPDQGFHRDPFVVLGHLATRLSKIGLGVAVTNPYTRHPVQIARAAGTLADLSQGRFVLGLGGGEVGGLRDRLGAPRTPFLPVVEAAIEAMRDLLDGKEVTLETPAFAIKRVRLEFEPHHRVPMYLATTAIEGLRLTGRAADGLILADVTDPDVIGQCLQAVAKGAEEGGRDPSDIAIVTWITTIVTDDVVPTRNHLRRVMAGTVCAMHRDMRLMLGVDDGTRAQLREALERENGEFSAQLFPDALFDRMAIVGNADDCIKRIRAIEAAGSTQFAVRMPVAAAAVVDYASNLRAIAEGIIPSFR